MFQFNHLSSLESRVNLKFTRSTRPHIFQHRDFHSALEHRMENINNFSQIRKNVYLHN